MKLPVTAVSSFTGKLPPFDSDGTILNLGCSVIQLQLVCDYFFPLSYSLAKRTLRQEIDLSGHNEAKLTVAAGHRLPERPFLRVVCLSFFRSRNDAQGEMVNIVYTISLYHLVGLTNSNTSLD